ncbi:hypothetical protein L2E82_25766 [Cichorium intybus]|uniref:Uncharacterized protein n=1 Tax=Cichorium intybus TaxID=13427 RepID=A0ACB9E4E6_CICIN|nr:hypothetical protein L2E82_25766 [Cichorium intybus]
MAHEEHTPRCSNSSGGGGRLSKKLKNKKVPQRGMGVAQLEKIILEEQHKNDLAILTPNSTGFRPPPSIPLPPPLPPNHRPLIPTTAAMNPNFLSKPMHTISNGRNQNQNQYGGLDHCPYAAGMQYESNLSVWRPLPTTIAQRSQLFQQPCSSSLGNVSLGTTSTSSSSSVMNIQMEPPSNQSYCSNNYPPLWPHEEKMVGMKRPYPFPTENMPIPSFKIKLHFSPITRSNESTSCSNGGTNPVSRLITKDFLSLAPTRALPSEDKFGPFSLGEPTLPPHQPMYSFFPATKTHGNNNGEEDEHVDLNLKL